MSEEERYLTLFEKQFEIRDKLLKAKKRFENNTTDNRINYFKYYFLFFVYGSHLIFSLFHHEHLQSVDKVSYVLRRNPQ